jgi:hypothetical protein
LKYLVLVTGATAFKEAGSNWTSERSARYELYKETPSKPLAKHALNEESKNDVELTRG